MLYPPGFYFVKKLKRFVILSFDKSSECNLSSFFDIKRPRRIEHLQSEEPFSSDTYFSDKMLISQRYITWFDAQPDHLLARYLAWKCLTFELTQLRHQNCPLSKRSVNEGLQWKTRRTWRFEHTPVRHKNSHKGTAGKRTKKYKLIYLHRPLGYIVSESWVIRVVSGYPTREEFRKIWQNYGSLS